MQIPVTQEPTVPALSDAIVDPPMRGRATRFFVGSSTGVVTLVSDDTAEHHHMGD
jgi:hypothetical protein